MKLAPIKQALTIQSKNLQQAGSVNTVNEHFEHGNRFNLVKLVTTQVLNMKFDEIMFKKHLETFDNTPLEQRLFNDYTATPNKSSQNKSLAFAIFYFQYKSSNLVKTSNQLQVTTTCISSAFHIRIYTAISWLE